ncbi:unnamed protein product [Cunninghamella blakesleeana]
MVIEKLCAKVVYTVPILEKIDVTCDQYIKPQEKSMDVLLPGGKYNQKCQTIASIPRLGYTRGEIIPLKIVVNHFESYTRQNALEIELVRVVEIRTQKNTSTNEDILKTVKQDINIIGPYNFSQSTTSQLMIPTSTPPTIKYKEKALHIHYIIRIRVRFGKTGILNSQGTTSTLEMPFVVGTWPRADIPIDDDDEELAGIFGETMLSDDDDDEYEDDNFTEFEHRDINNNSHFHQSRFSVISTSSVPTLSVHQYNNQQNNHHNNDLVGRSDSTTSRVSAKSHGSQSSWRSSQSYDTNNNTLARNNTSNSMSPLTSYPSPHSFYNNSNTNNHLNNNTNNNTNNNNINNPSANMIYSNSMMNKSSSTPDLLAGLPLPPPSSSSQNNYSHPYTYSPQQQSQQYSPQQQQQQYNGYIYQYQNGLSSVNENDDRQSTFDDGMNSNNRYYYPSPSSTYRQVSPQFSQNIVDPTLMSNTSTNYSPYQHSRTNSDDYRLNGGGGISRRSVIDEVPTRVLEPISPASTSGSSTTNRFRTQQQQQQQYYYPRRSDDTTLNNNDNNNNNTINITSTNNNNNISHFMNATISDDDDDDDDENDLLAIIEKKKKLEMRRKQGMVYSAAQ